MVRDRRGGDLLAAHLPEFWQQGDEREGQHRADARKAYESSASANARWAPAFLVHSRDLLWGVGQAVATEGITGCICGGGVQEAEPNMELLSLVSIPTAADWDASVTVERMLLARRLLLARCRSRRFSRPTIGRQLDTRKSSRADRRSCVAD